MNRYDQDLIASVVNNNTKGVKMALSKGADIDANDSHALRYAALENNLHMTMFLVEHNANVNALDDWALSMASWAGNTEVANYLIINGANVHANDNVSLKWASYENKIDTIKCLVSHFNDGNPLTEPQKHLIHGILTDEQIDEIQEIDNYCNNTKTNRSLILNALITEKKQTYLNNETRFTDLDI